MRPNRATTPRAPTLRAALAAACLAVLSGCAGGPASPPPPAQGATYTTASGATVTVSGRVAAEGMVAR